MAGLGVNLVATDDAAIAYRDELLNADLKIYDGWLPLA
jgi:hypothetical protein